MHAVFLFFFISKLCYGSQPSEKCWRLWNVPTDTSEFHTQKHVTCLKEKKEEREKKIRGTLFQLDRTHENN